MVAVVKSRVCRKWERSRIWWLQALERDEVCLEKDSVKSNMKPDRLGIMGWVEGRERGVDYFRGLLRETDEKEFSFRGI